MPYPGAAFAIAVGVALGAAVYYYFFNDEEQRQQHRQNTYGRSRQYTYDIPRATQNTYDRSTQKTYDKSTQKTYDKSTQNTYDRSTQNTYNRSTQTTYDRPRQSTYESSRQNTNDKLIKTELTREKKDNCCTICSQLMTRGVRKLSCGHAFHSRCVTKWINDHKSCPSCRSYQSNVEKPKQHKQNSYGRPNRSEFEKKEKEKCTICLEEMIGCIIKLPCGHIFHNRCFTKWINTNNSCPNCRSYQSA